MKIPKPRATKGDKVLVNKYVAYDHGWGLWFWRRAASSVKLYGPRDLQIRFIVYEKEKMKWHYVCYTGDNYGSRFEFTQEDILINLTTGEDFQQ
ncbi:MAG: hypothetical protein CMI54_00370 [Parcubacteria group bacterium]|nr:hypothetical protein [Parcubacteria group bacterium]|tara:strand:- start:4677 stop:4958 length:282 start_codon:yes stop_codon:yes gene_type:complete